MNTGWNHYEFMLKSAMVEGGDRRLQTDPVAGSGTFGVRKALSEGPADLTRVSASVAGNNIGE